MKDTLKKLWRDPVWSAVIAAALVGVWGYLSWDFVKQLGALATQSSALPNWLVALLTLGTTTAILIAAYLIWIRFGDKSAWVRRTFKGGRFPELPDLHLRWKLTRSGYVDEITTFCVEHDYRLIIKVTRDIGDHTSFLYCELCKKNLFEYEGIPMEMDAFMRRLVDREYRRRVGI